MAIKVLIKRKFKTGNRKQVSQLLNRARYGAMGMKGYLSSETLTDLNDPDRIAVASMWRTLDDWKNWKKNPSRAEVVGELVQQRRQVQRRARRQRLPVQRGQGQQLLAQPAQVVDDAAHLL